MSQKKGWGRSGVRIEKEKRKRKNEEERTLRAIKGGTSRGPTTRRPARWHASSHLRAKASPQATRHPFVPRPIFFDPWNVYLEARRTGTQTKMNCATTVSRHGYRENPSRQKSSYLFFVRRSLCQEMPNKERATVITLFLPPGISRVSTHKTRQPGPNQSNPTKTRHIKKTSSTFPRFRGGLTNFNQLWPRFDRAILTRQGPTTSKEPRNRARSTFPGVREVWQTWTKFDQDWPILTEVWPSCWPDQKLN